MSTEESSARAPLTLSQLFSSRTLAFPWATAALVSACAVTTLPMFFSSRYYLVLGVGYELATTPQLFWWHRLTSAFVHGGGFPGTAMHLLINCSLFIVQGSLVERTLGSGRYALLTLTCFAVGTALKELIVDGYAQGASIMTWSYGLFAAAIASWVYRRGKAQALRDPMFWLFAVVLLVGTLGLIKHWHLWNLLTSVPFFLWWRSALYENLARIENGREPERWPAGVERTGIVLTGALCLFSCGMTLAAVLGILS